MADQKLQVVHLFNRGFNSKTGTPLTEVFMLDLVATEVINLILETEKYQMLFPIEQSVTSVLEVTIGRSGGAFSKPTIEKVEETGKKIDLKVK